MGGSLRHVIVHKNNHHGQIDYLRGLLEEDWDLTPRNRGHSALTVYRVAIPR